jgi:transposase-like protein/CheY-like chemotaxis protein
MTIEIVCPECASGYVLDTSAVGSAFTCPSCSRSMTIVTAAPSAAPVGPAKAAPHVRSAAVAAPKPQATAAPASPKTEIVCPRCQLHFSPKKHEVEVTPDDRPHILIVEEDGYSRDAAAEALSKEFGIVTADTVDAATRILSMGGIALMVVDLDIDHGTGKRLLRRGVLKTCPTVIYVNDESELYGDRWEAAREQGADDMVIKGMNAAETLVRKVGTLLGRCVDDEETT